MIGRGIGNLPRGMGILFLSLSFIMGAWAAAPAGTTYYVATTGSDSNPGTESQPWRTVQKAADTMGAGDTVLIREGIYTERVSPQHSGAEGAYITYAAYPGETVFISGLGLDIPEWSGLIDITNQSYIRVSGLGVAYSMTNPHNPGILADSCDHIIIENNSVYGTNDSGIATWTSTNVIIDGNTVESACAQLWNECISVGDTQHFEVKNNLVFDSPKEGICLKDGSAYGKCYGNEVHHTGAVGFYVDAQARHTHDIEVYGNVSHDGAEDGFTVASEVAGLLENVKLYNNVAYRNGWTGFNVSACCIDTHPVSNIQLVNNTSYDNGRAGWGGGFLIENPQGQSILLRNNIASQNLTFQIAVSGTVPPSSYAADRNLIDGFRDDPEEIRGDDYVEGDPRFVDAAGDDFHILDDSPGIGMGSATGAPATDYDGYPRGTPPDIGAFEHRGSAGCTLSCTATAPASAEVGEWVVFSATATPSSACTGSVSYDWDFGDGSDHAYTAQAQHYYLTTGTLTWKLEATVDTASCTKTGTITVQSTVTPPAITGVSKAGRPFRIKIAGAGFQQDVQVYLGGDASPWGNTVRKSDSLIVLKGGSSLKARFPKGQAVQIRVVNADGGEAVTTYTRP